MVTDFNMVFQVVLSQFSHKGETIFLTKMVKKALIHLSTLALSIDDEQQEDGMPEDDKSDEKHRQNAESAHRRRLQARSNRPRLGRVRQHVRIHGTDGHRRRRQQMKRVVITCDADVCIK